MGVRLENDKGEKGVRLSLLAVVVGFVVVMWTFWTISDAADQGNGSGSGNGDRGKGECVEYRADDPACAVRYEGDEDG